MRLSDSQTGPVPSFSKTTMEERKRSLVADDDVAPPSKRQASAANGNLPRMEPEKEKDVEVRTRMDSRRLEGRS